jgi:MFS transporter, DHA3 family, macrolide efflux protein
MTTLKTLFNRNLSFLWVGQFISQSGDSITHMAIIWLMLELTGSKAMTGFIAFAATLPALLFGLFAGVLADKYPRKIIMLISDSARFFLILSIPLLYSQDLLTPLVLAIIVFITFTFASLFNPARDSIIPQIADGKDINKVNALVQSTGYLSYFVGLFGAGILLGVMGLIPLFLFDALTFAFSIVFILLIRVPKKIEPTYASRHFDELKAGFRYIITEDRRILWLLLITALNNFFIMGPAIVGTPILIKEIWNGTGQDFAFVESSYGLGMLLATFAVIKLISNKSRGKWLMGALVFDGLTFIPLGFLSVLPGNPMTNAIIIIFIHSLGIPFIQVTRTSLIHSIVDNKMQGRIFSMIYLAVIGTTSLSVLVTGIAAEYWSMETIYIFIGFGACFTGLLGWLKKDIRNLQ